MSIRLLAVIVILTCVSPAWSSEITPKQTDWSGGPESEGPVSEWGTRFFSDENVAWKAIQGQVVLGSTAVANPERNPFPGEASGAIKIHASDIDLDGDTDVLGASFYGNEIVLFVNDGLQPPAWERQVIEGAFVEALAVAVADIDGDGMPDILGGCAAGAEVAWWRVGDFVDHGSLTSSILDTGGTIGWIDCSWDSDQPTLTFMTVEARSSHDPQEMGQWMALTPGPGCPGLLDGARYLQYRVLLDSQSDVSSPLLEEIRFSWEPRVLAKPRRGAGRVAP